MNIKQVTVFGGSGFVGRAIVRALAPQGYLIRVACRRIELAEPLKTAGDVGQITLMRANLRMPESVAVAVKGSDAVINAAGIPFQRGRQRYRAVHVEGARAIAEAARAAGVPRLVHMSGIGAESRSSKNRYIQSKVEAEDAIIARLRERHDPAAQRGFRARRRDVQPPRQDRDAGAVHARRRQRPRQGAAGVRRRRRRRRRRRAGAARHGQERVRAGRPARSTPIARSRPSPCARSAATSRSSACRPA